MKSEDDIKAFLSACQTHAPFGCMKTKLRIETAIEVMRWVLECKPGDANDKDMFDWIDRQVKLQIEAEKRLQDTDPGLAVLYNKLIDQVNNQ